MALSYASLGSGSSNTGFAIDTGDGSKTDVTLGKEYPAGGYQVSSANGNQGLFIFFGASDGTPAGGTSTKSIVASKAFNKLTIIGVTANDLITFTYKETATLNAIGTSSSYSGAVVTTFTPNQISSVNDSLVINGAALGANVLVKFTGNDGTEVQPKSITRISETQLLVVRPDTMPGSKDPWKITVQNPGIAPAVSTNTITNPLYSGSAPVWSTAATLPAFTKNVSYTQVVAASDPDGTAVTLSFVSGSLPAGLSFASNNGTISGTPTGSTSAQFTIRATEASGRYTDRTFTLPDAYPTFTTGSTLSSYTRTVPYTATIAASDDSGVAPSLSVVGATPGGLTFNGSTGVLTGTPTTSTNQTIVIRATDANGSATDQTFSIPNTGPTWSTSTTLPVYTKAVSYSTTLLATDDGTVTYSLISGSLPDGLTLNGATGVISGTPTVLTTHNPVVRVVDDAGNYVDRTFTLSNVGVNAPAWVTTAGALTNAAANTAYSLQLSATDDSGAAPSYSIASGTLPSGITLSSSGLISGTSAAASSSFTVRATDANGSYTDRSFTLTVSSGIIATGGTTSTVSGYKYHTFTGSGTFQTTTFPSGNIIEVLVAGGGGAGGNDLAGGGGAGGVIYRGSWNYGVTSSTVTIGGGGTDQSSTGNDSAFGPMTGFGGGRGANWNPQTSGSSGGSGGGGGGRSWTSAGASTQTSNNGGTGYGSAGGTGNPAGNGPGGGGGGAGAVGGSTASTPLQAGAGGDGKNTWSSWAPIAALGTNGYIAGGGGGSDDNGGAAVGPGGAGGGGTGTKSGSTNNGIANTGGGGGASDGYPGGAGGSGIVVVRYLA
jgi:hypothetical protein